MGDSATLGSGRRDSAVVAPAMPSSVRNRRRVRDMLVGTCPVADRRSPLHARRRAEFAGAKLAQRLHDGLGCLLTVVTPGRGGVDYGAGGNGRVGRARARL